MRYLLLMLIVNVCFGMTSGTLEVRGEIPPTLAVSVDNMLGALALNIEDGELDKYIGLVEETSNLPSGYQISLSSENDGMLVCESDALHYTYYAIRYDGDTYVSLRTVPEVVKTVNSQSMKVVDYSEVNINVMAYPDGIACIYQDTITIVIEAN